MKNTNDSRDEDLAGMNHSLDYPHPKRAKDEPPAAPKAGAEKPVKGNLESEKTPATSIGNE